MDDKRTRKFEYCILFNENFADSAEKVIWLRYIHINNYMQDSQDEQIFMKVIETELLDRSKFCAKI